MPSGDPFAEARTQFTVESDQIDFLASDGVANEKIEPLPFGIASENHWLHHFSRPSAVVLVQQDEVNIQVADRRHLTAFAFSYVGIVVGNNIVLYVSPAKFQKMCTRGFRLQG